MKKIFQIIGLISLTCFSFFVTEKTALVVSDMDEIMIEIKANYEDCNNGNVSSIHWDLVLIQTEEYGGGEIYFDDVLIRKDGKFVLDNLKQLN